jgi:hypothetical protein
MEVETSKNGSSIERFLYPGSDSGSFAAWYLKADDWNQIINQGFEGFWANVNPLELCTYCEGDIVIMRAPSVEVFTSEKEELLAWYADNNR